MASMINSGGKWGRLGLDHSFKEIEQKVGKAIMHLLKNDAFLLENDANERSVSHKLAEYFQTQFPEWHVDCEYNLKFDAEDLMKRLTGIENCSEEKKTDRVFPDIIIHQRNTKNNLLVIEIKTNNQDSTCDIKKLELFTSNQEYKYDFGLSIKSNSTNDLDLKWFRDGAEILNLEELRDEG